MALWQAAGTALRIFRTEAARALFAGLAAHSVLPLEAFGSAAFGWVLGVAAHAAGWPIPRGGSQQTAKALTSYLENPSAVAPLKNHNPVLSPVYLIAVVVFFSHA